MHDPQRVSVGSPRQMYCSTSHNRWSILCTRRAQEQGTNPRRTHSRMEGQVLALRLCHTFGHTLADSVRPSPRSTCMPFQNVSEFFGRDSLSIAPSAPAAHPRCLTCTEPRQAAGQPVRTATSIMDTSIELSLETCAYMREQRSLAQLTDYAVYDLMVQLSCCRYACHLQHLHSRPSTVLFLAQGSIPVCGYSEM